MKSLYCSKIGFVCPAVIEGDTDDEVIQKAREHVNIVHNIKPEDISSEMQQKIREQLQTTVPS
jgi:predicted small metal-binding protein